ncbi:MAG: stage IV sporulation protein A [Firmicutes bacterium]|nr:stage IV sporulation protein A [Bacillota bacterium]
MEKLDLFRDIIERTGGDIYIGAVGPVRSGKSTFVTRFMELLVLPYMEEGPERDRALDELPMSGTGRTVTTTEPKFIPEDAVEVVLRDNIKFRVRIVDCVGYAVEGALGYLEDDGARMVRTPWFEEEIEFEQAAEVGTQKVITEHATIGVVLTSDGSIVDINRSSYEPAEEKVIAELKEIGKPFVVVLNSVHPETAATQSLAADLTEKYQVPVLPMDVMKMELPDIYDLMQEILYEFPVQEVNVHLPAWFLELDSVHWLRSKLEKTVREAVNGIHKVRDIDQAVSILQEQDYIDQAVLADLDLGQGITTLQLIAPRSLLFQILEETCGRDLKDDKDLLRVLKEYTAAKVEYDKIADALYQVERVGYGIVPPQLGEMILEEPEVLKSGGRFGIRLRASAPSIHMIRTDIRAEVAPIVGTEKQSEELAQYLLDEFEDSPEKLWETNLFGKSLRDLVKESIQGKLYHMPEDAQQKLKETLERIVNEGSGGLICIIL